MLMKVIRKAVVRRKQNGQFTWHAKAAGEEEVLVCAPPKDRTVIWFAGWRLQAAASHTYISLTRFIAFI